MEKISQIKETLYALSTTGKIKEWKISVGHDETKKITRIITEHGYKDGKKQTDIKIIKTGKNLGKSNETSAFGQATADALSKWVSKHDKNYIADIKKLSKEKDTTKSKVLNLLPMLAHEYKKKVHTVKYPVYVQPKLNGIRCITRKVSETKIRFTSRRGKEFPSMTGSPIEAYLLKIMKVDGVPLDGELFNPSMVFEDITSAVSPKKDIDRAKADEIQYWVYDCIDQEKTFKERTLYLHDLIKQNPSVVCVETHLVNSEKEMLKFHKHNYGIHYEGTMVRIPDSLYALGHRSSSLLKYKDFIDSEFKIVGFTECEGRETGCIKFICETPEGLPFDVRPIGTQQKRREWFKIGQTFIGEMLTIRYQELSTEDRKPLFPRGIAIRDYE